MSLAVAIGTSVLLTALAVRYKEFAYQRRWARAWTFVAYAVVLLLGAAAGWAGWLVADAIGWKPADSAVVRGVIYGVVGNAMVRVHLNKVPGDVEDVFAILSTASEWIAGALDVEVEHAIRARLDRSNPTELAQYVSFILNRYVLNDSSYVKGDDAYSRQARFAFEQLVNANVKDLLAGGDKAIQATSSLRTLGETWVPRYVVDPPEPA
jgi:hypothetical protein